MKKKLLISVLSLVVLAVFAAAGEKGKPTLDPVQKMELLRLEETWNVLDQVAAKVWPGWKGYADVPFLFEYENQTRMLVGHDDPPEEFELVEGVTVRGKKVYLDRTNEVAVPLTWPTAGGGGPLFIGRSKDRSKRIDTVCLNLNCIRKAPDGSIKYRSEDQILLNIHELFHCWQHVFYQVKDSPGNLRYNSDTNYAIFSDIEGQALYKAFQAKGRKASLGYLRDFMAARSLKYASLTELEQRQEKSEDFMEGTARYSEYATVLEIRRHYKARLTAKDDPYFTAFKDTGYFLNNRLEALKRAAGNTTESRGKCYEYGCYQALLLNRVAPGWQKDIPAKYATQYEILRTLPGLGEADVKKAAEGLKGRYGYDALFAKHNPPIKAREDAFKVIDDRQGRKYHIDFRKTGDFPFPTSGEPTFVKVFDREHGILRYAYPEGFKSMVIQSVTIEGKGLPLEDRELYKVAFVDTKGTGHRISASRVENNVYYDLVMETDGFTLKVPKAEIKDNGDKVDIIILSKV